MTRAQRFGLGFGLLVCISVPLILFFVLRSGPGDRSTAADEPELSADGEGFVGVRSPPVLSHELMSLLYNPVYVS